MKDKLIKYKNKLSNYFNLVSTNYKSAFYVLLAITFVFALIFILVPNYYNTFYNCNTDDVIQYYPYVAGFFEKIKTGTLSIYDTALFGGTSFFSGTYYIPIDIFLVIAFFLSFIIGVYRAYFISILLKIFCSSYVFYYVLKTHKVRPLVCVVISLVYSLTGLLEAYFVFPVYLGIIFYAPVAMILVDMFLSQKKKYLSYYLIPAFVLQIVIFDYYLAYMLLAFMAIYFVYSLFLKYNKDDLLKHKPIKQFGYFFLLIFVGVFVSATILLPSALYILNETSRTNNEYDKLFYFTTWSSNKGAYVISLRHYFTQIMNFYIPNNPHVFMLVEAGDYVREHATLYMTLGVYIYLIKSLTLGDKKSNLLRIFSISLNIMLLIPVFSMIFTAQKVAYVRWFFIPFIFNLLTACNAMDKCNFKLFEAKDKSLTNKLNLVLPLVALAVAFILVLFTLIKNPEYFIHYDATTTSDYFFKGILIPSAIFIGIYILLILLPLGIKSLGKYKEYFAKLIPLTVLCELIFGLVIVLISIGSTSTENEYKNSSSQVKHLRSVSNYDFNAGYRINLYTNEKCIANNNVSFLNVNCTNFFQSFYNTPLNAYMKDINEISNTSWSRRSIYGYSLLNAPMYNNKYVITNNFSITSDSLLDELVVTNPVTLSNQYYKKLDDYNNNSYYELTNIPNFIVYDSVYYGSNYSVDDESTFVKDISLLKYGYASLDNTTCNQSTTLDYLVNNYTSLLSSLSSDEQTNLKSLIALNKAGLVKYSKKDVIKNINNSKTFDTLTLTSATKKEGSNYLIYDLSNKSSKIFDHDIVYAYPYDSTVASMDVNNERYWMYFSSNEYDAERLCLEPFHYNVSYIKDLGYTSLNAPDKFYMKYLNNATSEVVNLYGFDYDIYDEFINTQNSYENRYYSLDSNIMTIKFTNDAKAKVIKTAYTYSSDWQIENNTLGYETVSINGGFLGIIVPKGVTNVDISLRFMPKGYENGFKITQIGVIIYTSIISIGLMIEMKNKIGDSL